jgi:hypothetical protein
MNPKKLNRRKGNANKLEPIDWHEFANDAVLNGNMSTLYRRPPSEDPSAYASPEAMIEIEKRVIRPVPEANVAEALPGVSEVDIPTVGPDATVGSTPIGVTVPPARPTPTVGPTPAVNNPVSPPSTPPRTPTVGVAPAVGALPPVSSIPAEAFIPTAGPKKKVKPIRTVQDALTLAGQVLYRAMLGSLDAQSTSCTKGYRQLAAETHLDKDTVRDLIVEFKQKGILHETATYDPDTRLSKTYEVLSNQVILQGWRNAGIQFVTAGRQRPLFCSAAGELLAFKPTVGTKPIPPL